MAVYRETKLWITACNRMLLRTRPARWCCGSSSHSRAYPRLTTHIRHGSLRETMVYECRAKLKHVYVQTSQRMRILNHTVSLADGVRHNINFTPRCKRDSRTFSNRLRIATTSLAGAAVAAAQPGSGALIESLEQAIPLTPSNFIAGGLQVLHLETGLPYYACVSIVAIALRLMFFPIIISQFRNMALLEINSPKLGFIRQNRIRALLSRNTTLATYYKLAQKREEEAIGASMWKSFQLMFAFAPISIIFITGLRTLWSSFPQLIQNESFLWIESMASPDPYYALPILTSATMLLTMFLGWRLRGLTPNWKIATLMTAAAGISAYVSSTLPAILQFYVFPLILLSFTFNVLSHQRWFRRLFGIPTAPIDYAQLKKLPVPELDAEYSPAHKPLVSDADNVQPQKDELDIPTHNVKPQEMLSQLYEQLKQQPTLEVATKQAPKQKADYKPLSAEHPLFSNKPKKPRY